MVARCSNRGEVKRVFSIAQNSGNRKESIQQLDALFLSLTPKNHIIRNAFII